MKNFLYLFGLILAYIFVPGLWHFFGLILGREQACSLLGESGFMKALIVSLLGAVVFNGGVIYLVWKKRTKILDNLFFVCVLFGFFLYMRVSKKRTKLPKNIFPALLLLLPMRLFAGDGGYLSSDFYLQLWIAAVLFGLFILTAWYLICGTTFGPVRFFAGIAYGLGLSASVVLGFLDLFLSIPNYCYPIFFVAIIFLFLTGSLWSFFKNKKEEVDVDDIYSNKDNIGAC